jgi:hypothetical protein
MTHCRKHDAIIAIFVERPVGLFVQPVVPEPDTHNAFASLHRDVQVALHSLRPPQERAMRLLLV